MSTATSEVYCTWCGDAVTGGRRFCSSCGRRVDGEGGVDRVKHPSVSRTPEPSRWVDAPVDGVEQTGLRRVVGKMLGSVGMAVAIPVMVILSLLSTAVPLLIVVALFMGPGDTWTMVRAWVPGSGGENAACAGFDDWYQASADRSQEAARLAESYQSSSATDPASLRSLAAEVDVMATEQRRSNPPQEAVALNGMMVETLELPGEALRAMASGDQDSVRSSIREAERLAPLYDAEEKRVFDLCK